MVTPKKPKLTLDQWGFPPVVSADVLTHLTGVSAVRLSQLVTDQRIPAECRAGHGKWHTSLTIKEIFGYYRRQADKAKPQEDKDIAAQINLEDLRARRLKNAKTARDLLPRHVYIEAWGELLSVFKNRWMNFGAKMGPRAFRAKDKVEASEILDKEVSDIFAGLVDPRVMEDIAAKIRDDEFNEQPEEDGEASGDLATGDAEAIPEGSSGISGTSAKA